MPDEPADTVLKLSLTEEFVPLSDAARVAYIALTNTSKTAETDAGIAQASHLVGIALSTVAPIYMTVNGGSAALVLGPAEIERLLFQPLRQGARPAMDGLCIRRRHLKTAIATLKEARAAFSGRQ